MFPGDYYEALGARLDKIHNDLLGIHLSMVVDKMHEVGVISTESYARILDKEHELISKQLTGFKKK